jgi:hypothetical protein
MSPSEPAIEPGSLFLIGLGLAVVGGLLLLTAILITKLMGMDINSYARETRWYRDAGFLEQMSAFHSDPRNIPVMIFFVGLLALVGAIVTVLWAGGWYLVRLFGG